MDGYRNMSKYYVVLTGAIKNAGDYLITEKCKELLQYFRPDYELIQYGRWESLEDKLDVVNNAEALILMGGPAVSKKMYPGIYKLTENLEDIKVPVIPMAVGWNSDSGDFNSMLNFKFTDKSLELLEKIKNNGNHISVRDFYTNTLLQRYNVENSTMTGCASWYTPEKIGKGLMIEKVETIAFTPAQDPKYAELSMKMMKLLRDTYPDKKIFCSFHRGIATIDDYTDRIDAENTKKLSEYATSLNMENIDLSYSFDNYQKYDMIDYHIGFRVHAHLYFLSNRKPSILLHEDGRGKSMSETIGLTGIDAFKTNYFIKKANFFNKVFKKLKLPINLRLDVDYEALDKLEHMMKNHEANHYTLYNGVFKTFDSNFKIMEKFIMDLP